MMGEEELDIDRYLNVGRRIAIDMATPVQVEIEGVVGRLRCVVVGMEPERYLILSVPPGPAGLTSRLVRGNPVVVRYLFRGSVYAFQSQTLGAITDPVRVFFLAYPKVIQEHNLRGAPRVACHLPAHITVGKKEHAALVVDVSLVGCRVSLPPRKGNPQLAVGASLSLALRLPGVASDLSLSASVRSTSEDSSGLMLGCHFEEIDPKAAEQLGQYLQETNLSAG